MNEREDYLDKLLRGVEGESDTKNDEDDFFSRFGSSVSDDDEEDFLKAFEKSRSQKRGSADSGGDDLDFDLDDIDNIVSNIKNGTLDDLDAAGSLDDDGDLSIEESLKNYDEDDFGLGDVGTGYADFGTEEEPGADSDFEVNTLDGNGEPDNNPGEANQELLDMLSGIGDDSSDTEDSLDDLDSLAEEDFKDEDFVNNLDEDSDGEMSFDGLDDAQTEADDMESLARQLESLGIDGLQDPNDAEEDSSFAEDGKEKKDKKVKKGRKAEDNAEEDGDDKKPGFFSRLGKLLFGEEDKEIDASDVDNLSEEDKRDLQKMEDEEAAKEKQKQQKAEQKEEQKEQKKKEQEEKKAQKNKEKEEKKAQKEKIKAEKAQKKKDIKVIERSKPLPKGPVVLIMLVGISLVILVNLLSSQVGYMLSVSQAQEYYDQGDYVKAYTCFTQGEEVKAVHEELYNKARLTAYVQQQLNSYRVFKKQNMHADALGALIVGVGRYDKNADEAAVTGAAMEYEKMLSSLEKALKKQYGMTLEQARELYAIREKEDFTLAVYKVIEELGLSAEE